MLKSKKVVVTGGNGRFGKTLFSLTDQNFLFPSKKKLNILSLKSIEKYLKRTKRFDAFCQRLERCKKECRSCKGIWNRDSIVFFFSQGPPRTRPPDTTPKIPFPYYRINYFMKEKPPTSAFHHELSENHQKSARDG